MGKGEREKGDGCGRRVWGVDDGCGVWTTGVGCGRRVWGTRRNFSLVFPLSLVSPSPPPPSPALPAYNPRQKRFLCIVA
ncbi:MAG: hypothetical protein ACHBN1_21965 [Heteroscytonema crispum UTEX LB 1556]